eukprot:gene7761-5440_t
MFRFRMLVVGIMVALKYVPSSLLYLGAHVPDGSARYTTILNINITSRKVLDRWGPKVQLMLSGILAMIGLCLFGLALDGKIHSDNRSTIAGTWIQSSGLGTSVLMAISTAVCYNMASLC